MATKRTLGQRVADLKPRFARIKIAIMAVDALTADYLDRTASDLEAFAGELAQLTGREDDTSSPN